MNVLFYRYGSICEPFILSAFRELGIAVTELTAEMTNKSMAPSSVVELVSQTVLDGNFQFVFSINFFPVVSETCSILHIPYVGWTVDSPVMELYSKSITNSCNYIFLFDQCQYSEIAPLNPGHIFYLPLASDPDYMQSVIQSSAGSMCFASDISFVGSLYTEKCPYDKLTNPPSYLKGYLDGLIAAQLEIYGYYFVEEVLPDDIVSSFREHLPGFYTPLDAPYLTDRTILAQLYIGNKITAVERMRFISLLASHFSFDIYTGSDTSSIAGIRNRGLAKTLTEMPLIFANSTINLNMTSKPIRSGIPLRIWDILSCGGFVITNYQSELPEFFTIGETIEIYENEDDLINKCNFYLEHPEKAREIAQNGLELVRSQHTYRHRIEQMITAVFEPRNQENPS